MSLRIEDITAEVFTWRTFKGNWENFLTPCAYFYLKTLINLSTLPEQGYNLTGIQNPGIPDSAVWPWFFSKKPKLLNFSKCISTKGRHIRVFSCPCTLSHDMALLWTCQYWFLGNHFTGFYLIRWLWNNNDCDSLLILPLKCFSCLVSDSSSPLPTTLFRAFLIS